MWFINCYCIFGGVSNKLLIMKYSNQAELTFLSVTDDNWDVWVTQLNTKNLLPAVDQADDSAARQPAFGLFYRLWLWITTTSVRYGITWVIWSFNLPRKSKKVIMTLLSKSHHLFIKAKFTGFLEDCRNA